MIENITQLLYGQIDESGQSFGSELFVINGPTAVIFGSRAPFYNMYQQVGIHDIRIKHYVDCMELNITSGPERFGTVMDSSHLIRIF